MKLETCYHNGIINPIIFNYAKALTIFKIYECYMGKDDTLNEQRLQALS